MSDLVKRLRYCFGAVDAAEAADRIEALEREKAQAAEAIQELTAGKPLGPIVGAHTIQNMAVALKKKDERIEELERQNKELRDALQDHHAQAGFDAAYRFSPLRAATIAALEGAKP